MINADTNRDLRHAALLCFVHPIAVALAIAVLVGVAGVVFGSCHHPGGAAIAATVDTVRITDTVYRAAKIEAAKAEQASTVAKATSDKSDQQVIIVSDGVLAVRATPAAAPVVVIVPVAVTNDIANLRRTVGMQAVAIMRMNKVIEDADATIRARDNLIALLKPARRWGLDVASGYGPQREKDGAVRLGWHIDLAVAYRLF